MNENEIEQFNPTIAELRALVEVSKDITATDLKDKAQLEIVKKNRIVLKQARVDIEKKGKELREGALKYQKAVIAKEKELVAIIEPEENRLSEIEEQAKKLEITEKRKELLPLKKERLVELGKFGECTDEELLEMDEDKFEKFYNDKKAELNAEKELQLQKERQELEAKENEIKRQEEIKLAKEKALEDERQRIAIEKERQELEAEKEKMLLEKRKAFTDYRASLGYTEETKTDFKMEETATSYVFYKKIGEFTK